MITSAFPLVAVLLGCFLNGPVRAAGAPSLADRVLVVENLGSPVSVAVADDYARRRGVHQILAVTCPDSATGSVRETIHFADLQKEIEAPLKVFLSEHPGIDFIVLTKGIPIRIADAPQGARTGRLAVDSYLSALGYNQLSNAAAVDITDPDYGGDFHGRAWVNRFWNSTHRFSHARFGGYLVTRLDGYMQDDAMALTTRSLAAEKAVADKQTPAGAILLDVCPGYGFADESTVPHSILPTSPAQKEPVLIIKESPFGEYNSDMKLARRILESRHIPVELELTDQFAGNRRGLRGYVSWGSNDQKYDAKAYHSLAFAPGALAETAVSTSARTFLPTSGGQSLIADLIAQGVTGVKGYTDEPLLQAVASPGILFERYTAGWTLAESFYAASRLVGWEDVVIGDPICRAYASAGDSSALGQP